MRSSFDPQCAMSGLAPRRCALGKGTLHGFPPQLEGQVSNGSCLQLADESSARRAGVIKADLELNQVIRQLAASIPTRTSTSPSNWCRWRRRMPKVCGSQDTCTIVFNASSTHGYSAGWYPAALQIEDFPRQPISLAGYGPVTTADPLSKIPLQFLVNVIEVSAGCDDGPLFAPSMAVDGACVPASSGDEFVFRVEASQEKTSASIADIALIGPPSRMTKSSLQDVAGSSKAKFMDITWPIPLGTTGTYMPCLKVRDTNWQFSEQRCMQILVSADRVEHILSTRQPTGEIGTGALDWSIAFNSEIFSAVSSAFIRVMINSSEVYAVNAFNSSSVFIINGTVLQFHTPNGILTPGYTHHVLMDRGVVTGNSTCPGQGPPWVGIRHQGVGTQLWTVDVKCPAGYRRAIAGGCDDIDECSETLHNCHSDATCSNNAGNFSCACNSGYQGNGTSCDDVNECKTGNHDCDVNANCSNTIGSFDCLCVVGYQGDGKTCTDTDECSTGGHNCHAVATCNNTVGSFKCACNAGYTGDGLNCTDVNECTAGNHDCDVNANCSNTIGSFDCLCVDGYQGDGKTCTDTDECSTGHHNCHSVATCNNTVGSFSCVCNVGYMGDGLNCTDEDECVTNSHNCDVHADCSNTVGSFQCACVAGYRGDGMTCQDVDECVEDIHDCHPYLGLCENSPGGFRCHCRSGYCGDGRVCYDIDECISGIDSCHHNATCTNTAGSFSCTCNTGYTGNGTSCEPLDECVAGVHNCDQHADCHDLPESFFCTCHHGYRGDGVVCNDINECLDDTHNCHKNATCTNIDGTFYCACAVGFGGNGTHCQDIDECLLGTDDCDVRASCTNVPGSYHCDCNTGFTGNGTFCRDIDECIEETDDCHPNATCFNSPGSYSCSCNIGYSGNGTHCQDADECSLGADNCHLLATCTNTPGSFYCTCLHGYRGDGVTCANIDECQDQVDNCDVSADCTDLPGSFSCACHTGYSGNGTHCSDIDECAAVHHCHQNAICTNLPGAYNCTCQAGYLGNGIFCTDMNECETGSHDCHPEADCLNRPGSYHCQCRVNYRGNGTYCEFHVMRLAITCNTNCDDLVNPSRPLRLLANCTNCPRGIRPSYSWYLYRDDGWHSRNGSLLTEVDLPPLTTTGIHAVSLSVKEGSLQAEEKYRVWLHGNVTGEGHGWAELVLRTNSPPENGTCRITPASGYAYQTRFTIECTGWVDDNTGTNGSLSYFFFANVGDDSTLLMHGSDAETPPIYIRVGDPGRNWTANVEIRIIDVLGDYRLHFLTVQVMLRPDWSTLTVDNNYLRQTIAARNATLQLPGSDTCTLVTTAVEAVGSSINNDAWNSSGGHFSPSGNTVSSVPKEQREQDRLVIAKFLEDNWGCGTSVGDLIQYVSAIESLTNKADELTHVTKLLFCREKRYTCLPTSLDYLRPDYTTCTWMTFATWLQANVASIISNLLQSALGVITERTPNPDLSPEEIIWYEKEFGLRSANEGMLLKDLVAQLMAALHKFIRVINKRMLVGEPRFEVIRPSFELLIDRSFADDVGNRVIETGHGSVTLPGKDVMFSDDGAKEFVDAVILVMHKNPYSWNMTSRQLSTPVMDIFFIADEDEDLVMENLEDYITLKLTNNDHNSSSENADVQTYRFSGPGEMLYYKVKRNSDDEALILRLTDVSENVDFEIFAQKGQRPNETNYAYKAIETPQYGSVRFVVPAEALDGSGTYLVGVREVTRIVIPIFIGRQLTRKFRLIGTKFVGRKFIRTVGLADRKLTEAAWIYNTKPTGRKLTREARFNNNYKNKTRTDRHNGRSSYI
ncbi:LTBP4 [Branchiostoma lanceolatum]|uniref:LTBP4 protein n=1 Tax=Branchiostoma lanceolatum TaxID=7740 RepID=A0A8K0ELV7_BRALA|nr:LTBP4 [Branchiostoma lanceolatum]